MLDGVFERFNEPARQVIVHAQLEARDLGHNYIGTEHLLLGMFALPGSAAARALATFGASSDTVRARLLELVARGEDVPTGQIPFTPRAKKVLELSLREALSVDHDHIGTEHLLLGLLREGEGVGAKILKESGVDLVALREETLKRLAPPPSVLQAPSRRIGGPGPEGEVRLAVASVAEGGNAVRIQPVGFAVVPDAEVRQLLMSAGALALSDGRTRIELRDVVAALGSAGGAEPPAGGPAEDDPAGP